MIDIVATTISGSVRDWKKIPRLVPLFEQQGRKDVRLHVVGGHAEARRTTRDLAAGGARTIISAGGSGTFNNVLEGCIDSGVPLKRITLGFLRKGSADLIGKALGMPDDVQEAVRVFTASLEAGRTVPCDILRACTEDPNVPARHFVGYGGAGIFGRIPRYTENRYTKYYKGILGQLFGDLGPFTVGALLATIDVSVRRPFRRERRWEIVVNGTSAPRQDYQALILLNGDLGPELPFARNVALGSGDFWLFGIRDLGLWKLPTQVRRAFDASILDDPQRWGLESWRVVDTLKMGPVGGGRFPLNVDGSTLQCCGAATIRIVDRVNLIER